MPDLWTTRAVAAFLFLTLLLMVVFLFFFDIPKANHDIIIALSGAITSASLTVVSFFFGSSKSSQDKDATIQKMAGDAK